MSVKMLVKKYKTIKVCAANEKKNNYVVSYWKAI